MENIKVDVIIPAYHPGKEFSTLIERLTKQTFPIHRIIVMNTEETYWNKELEEKFSILEVHHLKKQEFDHGATRACAAELSDADVMVCMPDSFRMKTAVLSRNTQDLLIIRTDQL